MVYIPSEWFKDKKNEPEVFALLNDYCKTDLRQMNGEETERVIHTLRSLGEFTILEHFNSGNIAVM